MQKQEGTGADQGCGKNGPEIRILDGFAGIGGMRLGFEQACREAGYVPRCEGFIEIDDPAMKTYRRHFPDTPELGDVAALATSGNTPDHDVLLAGFCCQSFSKAGLKLGFEDARGTLFFSLVSILEAKKPKAFLFENVGNLVHHDGGRTLTRILEILDGLGYKTRFKVLNSRDFGVAQNRERIFLVGFREGGEGFEFPDPTDSAKRLKDVLESSPVDPRYYLSEASLAGARRRKVENEAAGKGFGFRILDPDGVAHTLVCGGSGLEGNLVVDERIAEFPVLPRRATPLNREGIRHLTPLEYERLQGFQPDWTAGQADGHRYRQLANAVTVPVVSAISRKLLDALGCGLQDSGAQVTVATSDGRADKSPTPVAPTVVTAPRASAFRYVDLFCGLGGFRLACESLGGECVFSSEIDEPAGRVYAANFGELPSGDITKIDAHDIPYHDILCGGFPCQSFSIAGKGLGFADETKGTLFFEVVRILKVKQPYALLLENVGGLVSHDGGRTLAVIIRALEEIGYRVTWKVLNASLYGCPTARKRIYIVAIRADLGVVDFRFPEPTREPVKLADVLLPDDQTDAYVVRNHAFHPDQDAIDRAEGKTALRLLSVGRIGDNPKAKQGYRVYSPAGHAVTFLHRGGGVGAQTGLYLVNGRVRKLHPREMARCMGVPESFVIPASSSYEQVRRMLGNSVVVPLVGQLIKRVVDVLEGAGVVAKVSGDSGGVVVPADASVTGARPPQVDEVGPPVIVPAAPEPEIAKLLSNGISKKGPLVFAWGISMPGDGCRFASKICAKYCYAKNGRFRWNMAGYARRYEASKRADFVDRVCEELTATAWRKSGERISCAAHEKGDFYSLDYLEKWGEVIRRMSSFHNLSFFIYTRSWVDGSFRKALERIGTGRNVRINLSTDREMLEKFGKPARIGDGLVTYLAETDDDQPAVPVDLVFRNLRFKPTSPMERLGGCLVCPHEANTCFAMEGGSPIVTDGKELKIRCQECRLCIDRGVDQWEQAKVRYTKASHYPRMAM